MGCDSAYATSNLAQKSFGAAAKADERAVVSIRL